MSKGKNEIPFDGGVGAATPAGNTVNLKDAETIKCEHCGNILFIPAFVLKRVSGLVSGTGKDAIVPIEMFSCGQCGAVQKSMIDVDALAGNQPTTEEDE